MSILESALEFRRGFDSARIRFTEDEWSVAQLAQELDDFRSEAHHNYVAGFKAFITTLEWGIELGHEQMAPMVVRAIQAKKNPYRKRYSSRRRWR